jgi:hypothetical protein
MHWPNASALIPPRLLAAHPELIHDTNFLNALLKRHNRLKQGGRSQDSPLLLVCPLESCTRLAKMGRSCPAHCMDLPSCPPARGDGQARLPWLKKQLKVVRTLLPPHPQPLANTPRLLLITTTYTHTEQLVRLEHLAASLAGEPNLLWLVVEDEVTTSPLVANLLSSREPPIPFVHLAYGPTRKGGNAQRNVALKYIRDKKLEGIVYNMDDDNAYHPKLWNALRRVQPNRVGVLAVRRGVFPPPRCDGRFLPLMLREKRVLRIERPLYDNATGEFVRFEAGWCKKRSWMSRKYGVRKFCVDMGGFAFDSRLLWPLSGELWSYTGHGGESELIERLLGSSKRSTPAINSGGGAASSSRAAEPKELQPLANCGRDVYVFHNEYRIAPVAMVEPEARCRGA